jgi:hypothetical protein
MIADRKIQYRYDKYKKLCLQQDDIDIRLRDRVARPAGPTHHAHSVYIADQTGLSCRILSCECHIQHLLMISCELPGSKFRIPVCHFISVVPSKCQCK